MRIGGSLLRRKPRVHIILSGGFEHTCRHGCHICKRLGEGQYASLGYL
jgi:hypothetical protein